MGSCTLRLESQPKATMSPKSLVSRNEIVRRIYEADPFDAFDPGEYEVDLHGWGANSETFEQLLEEHRPRLVIEVGTWKGASAVRMANIGTALDIENMVIVCVDTFLGSAEMWAEKDDPRFFESLGLHHGFPTVFYQFLANVHLRRLADKIVPLPLDSVNAASLLTEIDLVADAIYIDGAHDYVSVRRDLEVYWPLLRPGGLMFGDDYASYAPGVIRAVDEFARDIGKTASNDSVRKWWLIKS